MSATLRLTEIFLSLQGESRTVGIPTVFVRLTGCPLRCGYCDTAYAFKGGENVTIESILEQIEALNCRTVTVTGGEPLAQKGCVELLDLLIEKGYEVSLETCGALDISTVDTRVSRVMDLKTPGSGEVEKNLYSNIEQLTANDQVKFVICGRADYEWACGQLQQWDLASRCEVLFSPDYTQLEPRILADWVVEDRLPVRFQIQLHKYLWGDEKGR